MNSIAFVDTEIEPKSRRILDIGSVKDDGSYLLRGCSKYGQRLLRETIVSVGVLYYAQAIYWRFSNGPETGCLY